MVHMTDPILSSPILSFVIIEPRLLKKANVVDSGADNAAFVKQANHFNYQSH